MVAVTASAAGAGAGVVAALGICEFDAALLPATVATSLCLAPAIGTFVLADAVTRQAPDFGPAAMIVGTGIRMVVAVAGVFFLGDVLARFGTPKERFAEWVAYLYIVTLAIECALLITTARKIGKTNAGATP